VQRPCSCLRLLENHEPPPSTALGHASDCCTGSWWAAFHAGGAAYCRVVSHSYPAHLPDLHAMQPCSPRGGRWMVAANGQWWSSVLETTTLGSCTFDQPFAHAPPPPPGHERRQSPRMQAAMTHSVVDVLSIMPMSRRTVRVNSLPPLFWCGCTAECRPQLSTVVAPDEAVGFIW
jgi:hypothetical protein